MREICYRRLHKYHELQQQVNYVLAEMLCDDRIILLRIYSPNIRYLTLYKFQVSRIAIPKGFNTNCHISVSRLFELCSFITSAQLDYSHLKSEWDRTNVKSN